MSAPTRCRKGMGSAGSEAETGALTAQEASHRGRWRALPPMALPLPPNPAHSPSAGGGRGANPGFQQEEQSLALKGASHWTDLASPPCSVFPSLLGGGGTQAPPGLPTGPDRNRPPSRKKQSQPRQSACPLGETHASPPNVDQVPALTHAAAASSCGHPARPWTQVPRGEGAGGRGQGRGLPGHVARLCHGLAWTLTSRQGRSTSGFTDEEPEALLTSRPPGRSRAGRAAYSSVSGFWTQKRADWTLGLAGAAQPHASA